MVIEEDQKRLCTLIAQQLLCFGWEDLAEQVVHRAFNLNSSVSGDPSLEDTSNKEASEPKELCTERRNGEGTETTSETIKKVGSRPMEGLYASDELDTLVKLGSWKETVFDVQPLMDTSEVDKSSNGNWKETRASSDEEHHTVLQGPESIVDRSDLDSNICKGLSEPFGIHKNLRVDGAVPQSDELSKPEGDLNAEMDSQAPEQILGLDLDEKRISMHEIHNHKAARFTMWCTVSHKGSCRIASFSSDGTLAATGSSEMTLKVMDVRKMCIKLDGGSNKFSDDRIIIRSLLDHTAAVNDVAFHPNGLVLASAAKDCCIKLFDLTKSAVKRAFRYLQDSSNVRSISFHPCGDYILAGTDQEIIRLYDVITFQCYMTANPLDHHHGPIQVVRYAPTGKQFGSAGVDGAIKVWDGVSCRCVHTWDRAHNGEETTSVAFSRNGKYLLSHGKDGHPKLWDLRMMRVLHTFDGIYEARYRSPAIFNQNEDNILAADNSSNHLGILIWDSRTGVLIQRLGGHSAAIRSLAASPIEDAFISCGDDQKVRYWRNK